VPRESHSCYSSSGQSHSLALGASDFIDELDGTLYQLHFESVIRKADVDQ
jgi:hypothetical protein